MPAERRLTLIKAPSGFGKTTLLAECCRTRASTSTPVAWFSADDDSPQDLVAYLHLAFDAAGLAGGVPAASPAESSGTPHAQLASLLDRVVADGRHWVLALDRIERMSSPASIDLLSELVRLNVSGLSVAIACRVLPNGLDVTQPVFGGQARLLTAEDLRFSRQDIDRYFGGRLSRRRLDDIVTDTVGWPIAVRGQPRPPERTAETGPDLFADVLDGWLEAHLLEDLAAADREFLDDVALVDPIDPDLLDEALEGIRLMQRLDGISHLHGLVDPVRGTERRLWRLHPLVRRHCADRRRRHTPERYRAITARVARALARRGHTVAALRHAAEARDPALSGRILTDAGGLRLWLRAGTGSQLDADRCLSEEALASHPELAFWRAVALATSGQMDEARRVLAGAPGGPTSAGRQGNPAAGACIARAILGSHGCDPPASGEQRANVAALRRLADDPGVDRTLRGAVDYALCLAHGGQGKFDAALERANRAADAPPYLSALLDLQRGQIAMAHGDGDGASRHYSRAMAAAERLADTRLRTSTAVLLRELNLECNRLPDSDAIADTPPAGTAEFAVQAAAAAVAVDVTRELRGPEAAIACIDRVLDEADAKGLPGLTTLAAATKVDLLATLGEVTAAERTWHAAGLPPDDPDCLAMDRHNWRNVEALACARLRLHIAAGDEPAARRLADSLLATAEESGLARTSLRAAALAVVLEELTGNRDAALAHLAAYLRRFAPSRYARPLVRERETAVPLLRAYLDGDAPAQRKDDARALLDAAMAAMSPRVPTLRPRQREILAQLAWRTDREIADDLGISYDGVRYHIRRLFAKLNVRSRNDAVQRARVLGILSPAPAVAESGTPAAHQG